MMQSLGSKGGSSLYVSSSHGDGGGYGCWGVAAGDGVRGGGVREAGGGRGKP